MMSVDANLHAVMRLFADFPHRWAISGGWAIDLFLDRVMRPHKDVDIVVLRRDQLALQSFLATRGWTLEIAHDGALTPWDAGKYIELPLHTIWCKHPTFTPDFIEVLLNEADDRVFRFRRDPSITRDLDCAFITAPSGLPILAPEIALLYKSAHPELEENATDFVNALPHLNAERRAWLEGALRQTHPDHPWLTSLGDS